MTGPLKPILVGASALSLWACQGESAPASDAPLAATAAATSVPLQFFGQGYPNSGDACRRVGESEATSNFLDDSADLVGCPTAEAAEALGGKVVATIGGTTLVSVPRASGPAPAETTDALVAGTDYNATATIECAGYRDHPAGRCPAGVKRNREGGVTIVEIQWPKGDSRTLFFKDGRVLSADTNEADGSAKFVVKGERAGDLTTVTIGPERYVIPDAFVVGG